MKRRCRRMLWFISNFLKSAGEPRGDPRGEPGAAGPCMVGLRQDPGIRALLDALGGAEDRAEGQAPPIAMQLPLWPLGETEA